MKPFRYLAGAAWPIVLLIFATGVASAQEESVQPGVNKRFKDAEIVDFVETFEREGREVYDRREEIVEALGIEPGMQVADVGAGTGLFTRLLSPKVGAEGKVYAVDIAEAFARGVEADCRDRGMNNVEGVVCTDKSVELPAESIDLAFISDTYHHFEYPLETMRSIHRALRPGGRVVVIDFRRIQGESTEWTMNHVRAGEDVFIKEIESVGFKLVETSKLLKENYLLFFEKAGAIP